MKLSLIKLFKLLIWIITISNTASKIAIAQVTTDGTLNTQVETNGNVAEITGGEARGSNLFHSFQDFSVSTGNEAFFNNADSIANIFSRVTGGNVSNIDGLLRTNGSASLFLINPAGIIFGSGARLDIGGSFYGSTADSILFEGGEFSATNLENPPILTINAPIGLSFRDNPGEITVQGDGNGVRLNDSEIIDTQDALRVGANDTLGIIGGQINFEDATLKTAGGRFEIASVAGGEVNLVELANGFTFDYSEIASFQDINVSGTSIIDASGNGGGDIQIVGRNIAINDTSGIEANTLGDAAGGDINLIASESIELQGIENEDNFITAISSQVFANGTGDAGNINLETGNLIIGDRAIIISSNGGQGNAGNITIDAGGTVSLTSEGNFAAIISGNFTESLADAGDIEITTGSLSLSNGAFLSTNNLGQGNTGDIKIEAANNVDLTDASSINTIGSDSNSGNIGIQANSLTLNNQSALFANNSGQGNGGVVTLDITDNVDLTNNSAISVGGTVGDSGEIKIDGNSLTLNNRSILSAENSDQGRGGNIEINTLGNINIANNSFLSVSGSPGGSLNINANNLSILSDSNIFAGIAVDLGTSELQSGDIVIDLTEDLVLDRMDSDLPTSISNSSFGRGSSGQIIINARDINLNNGGIISSFVINEGNTGDITLNASGDINFNGLQNNSRSGVTNSILAGATGNAGSINITGQNLRLTDGAQIDSLVSGTANSGDINLNIDNTIEVAGFGSFTSDDSSPTVLPSTISSTINLGGVGDAGNINIATQNLALSRNGIISTTITQGQGNAGNININADLITIGEPGTTALTPSSISSEATTGLLNNPVLEANGGNIAINTGSLLISDGGSVEVDILAIGDSGDITINATDTVSVTGTGTFLAPEVDSSGSTTIPGTETEIEVGSDIRASVAPRSIGDGGNVEINAANFTLADNAIVSTSSAGEGNAGNINIDLTDKFTATNSLILSNIGTPQGVSARGEVGKINIKAQEVDFSDSAQIQAGLFSGATGNPGLVSITATESISFTGENTGIFSNNESDSVGNASNTQLSAPLVFLDNSAVLQASNQGVGNGGNIFITADNLELGANNTLSALTVAGTGGTINFAIAENIILRSGNLISAEALNDANGGIVDIDANFVVAFPNGNNDIVASAEQGRGGNISINAESIFGIEERPLNESTNDINASSDVIGFEGTVDITTFDTNPIEGATELPMNIVEPDQTIAQACSSNRQVAAKNQLIVRGKGGMMPAPDLPLTSLNIYVRDQGIEDNATLPPAVETNKGKIQPARGIRITDSGEIELTAYRTDNSGIRLTHNQGNCRG